MNENNPVPEEETPVTTTEETTEAVPEKKTLRDKLYNRINVSTHTMDIVIGVVVAALIIAFIVGIL